MKHIKFRKKEYVVIERRELEGLLSRIRLSSAIARDFAEDITYYANNAQYVRAYADQIATVSNDTIKYLNNVHNEL